MVMIGSVALACGCAISVSATIIVSVTSARARYSNSECRGLIGHSLQLTQLFGQVENVVVVARDLAGAAPLSTRAMSSMILVSASASNSDDFASGGDAGELSADFASSSEMIRRIEARISSIVGSGARSMLPITKTPCRHSPRYTRE
jgi:hypothetical protein